MMPVVTFYEKSGCATNQKQKKLLLDNGCILDIKSLLDTKFTPEKLIRFFRPLPAEKWFNPNAPQITRGNLNPKIFSAEEAILACINEPILIKRPLLIIGEEHLCGFDTEVISQLLKRPLKEIDNSCSKDDNCAPQ